MAKEYFSSTGSIINEVAEREFISNGGSVINATSTNAAAFTDLAATATSVSTASSTLLTGIKLSAALVGVATATANLTDGGLNSSAVSVSTATAALSTAIVLSSSAVGVSSSTAALTTSVLPGFTTPQLKNNSGTVLASETGVTVNVYNSSNGALVVRKIGLTSDASGYVVVRDAALVAATVYVYEVVLASNGRRLPTATAS